MLQYQTQVNQMLDAWCWQPLNTVLAQSDNDSVAKDAVVEVLRWDADNGVVPFHGQKGCFNEKKLSDIWILTFDRLEILSYLIIWSKLVSRSDSTSDKSRTTAVNCQYINYLREQNASLIVIMIDWATIRRCDYSHWKSPEIKKLGNVVQNLGNIGKPVSRGETISLGGMFVE